MAEALTDVLLGEVDPELYELVATLPEATPEEANAAAAFTGTLWLADMGLDLDDGIYFLLGQDLYAYLGEVPESPWHPIDALASNPSDAPNFDSSYEPHEEPGLSSAGAILPTLPAAAGNDGFRWGAEGGPLPSVLGSDSRTKVFKPNTWYPARTVGRLRVPNIDNTSGGCTATLVGPRHAITSAHCVVSSNGSALQNLDFGPGQDGSGNRPLGTHNQQGVYLRVASSAFRDYAIIGIQDSSQLASIGNMGFYYYSSGSSYNGKTTYVKGYPVYSQTCGSSSQTCNGFQWGASAVTNRNAQLSGNYGILYYPIDTSGGQSGSAVYFYPSSGSPAVMGVHKRSNSSGCGSCSYTSSPADQNVGPLITSFVYNDVCWMMGQLGPSAHRSHPCT